MRAITREQGMPIGRRTHFAKTGLDDLVQVRLQVLKDPIPGLRGHFASLHASGEVLLGRGLDRRL